MEAAPQALDRPEEAGGHADGVRPFRRHFALLSKEDMQVDVIYGKTVDGRCWQAPRAPQDGRCAVDSAERPEGPCVGQKGWASKDV